MPGMKQRVSKSAREPCFRGILTFDLRIPLPDSEPFGVNPDAFKPEITG